MSKLPSDDEETKSAVANVKIVPLTQSEYQQLVALLAWADNHCYRYGIVSEDKKSEKPCKRIKRNTKSTNPMKNNITECPAKLKMFHVSWMVENNAQLPDSSQSELRVCHRCVNPNRKKKSQRNVGAPCFEADHLELNTQKWNKEQDDCQKVIDDYVQKYSNDPTHITTGIIYVSDVPRECREDKFKDLVCRHNCFGNYGKIHDKKKK